MRTIIRSLPLLVLLVMPVFATSCDSLTSIALPATKITTAEVIAAGRFMPPGGTQTKTPNLYEALPEFCRVTATLTPSSDSDIKIEVWLPTSTWNRKLQAVGNGGWAGVISYSALAEGVKAGYASVSTDTGHSGTNGRFALDHPEKLTDFSWRSEHEMTVQAKAVVQAFYGNGPRFSYWNGCSTGGRQAFKEAQKFPDDFDGIIAGAPANRNALALWIAFALLKDPASRIPPAKYPVIHRAVLQACDALDGVTDGLIEDPTRCHFDPTVLLCKGAEGPDCLTSAQVEAARKVYSPAKNPRTGEELFPAYVPGSELGWGVMGGGPDPYQNILDQFQFVVFKDPSWNWRTFNFDSDIVRSNLPENVPMNATDPDLKPFFKHNGKLLIYHGWSDTNVATLNTIKYYKSVVDTMGPKTTDNVRLFLEPGMGHCGGGEGPNQFDKVGALDQWVAQNKAPERIIASHRSDGKVDRTRPLCAYPQVAKYKGSGSIDDAANFSCQQP